MFQGWAFPGRVFLSLFFAQTRIEFLQLKQFSQGETDDLHKIFFEKNLAVSNFPTPEGP